VSEATFASHFRSRNDCFLAAYDAATGCLLAAAGRAAVAERGSGARVRAALQAVLNRLGADPLLARACLLEVRRAGRAALAHEDGVIERLGGLLAPSGDGAGAELTAQLVAGGVWEAIRDALAKGSAADLPKLLDELHMWVVERQRPGGPSQE